MYLSRIKSCVWVNVLGLLDSRVYVMLIKWLNSYAMCGLVIIKCLHLSYVTKKKEPYVANHAVHSKVEKQENTVDLYAC